MIKMAAAGNIGSHVKIMVDGRWLVAVVRTMRLAEADGDLILADADFLGEGQHVPLPDAQETFDSAKLTWSPTVR